jgi:hypothetical protein
MHVAGWMITNGRRCFLAGASYLSIHGSNHVLHHVSTNAGTNTRCVLQASTERSRRLYLRHGFRDLETWHGAFPVFLMWRPAGGAPAAAAPAADANFSRPAAAATPGNSAASQQQDPAAAAAEAKAVAGDAGAAGAGGTAESEPGMIAGDSSRQQNEIGGGGSGSAPSMGSRHPPKSVSNGIVL